MTLFCQELKISQSNNVFIGLDLHEDFFRQTVLYSYIKVLNIDGEERKNCEITQLNQYRRNCVHVSDHMSWDFPSFGASWVKVAKILAY
jgi:hypothetical protein